MFKNIRAGRGDWTSITKKRKQTGYETHVNFIYYNIFIYIHDALKNILFQLFTKKVKSNS